MIVVCFKLDLQYYVACVNVTWIWCKINWASVLHTQYWSVVNQTGASVLCGSVKLVCCKPNWSFRSVLVICVIADIVDKAGHLENYSNSSLPLLPDY